MTRTPIDLLSPGELTTLAPLFAEVFTRASRFPLAVTLQPNFGGPASDLAVRKARSGFAAKNVQRARNLVELLFNDLDRAYTGCPKPGYLPPMCRFNGFVVLEKAATNPHFHLILSCPDVMDQVLRYMFLVGALDNVPLPVGPKDRAKKSYLRKQAARDQLASRRSNWLRDVSLIKKYASCGTADVQMIMTEEDSRDWCSYITKEWRTSFRQLVDKRSTPVDNEPFAFFELRDFFSPMGAVDPARAYKLDQNTRSSQILDLDAPPTWRQSRGRTLKPSRNPVGLLPA